MFSSTSSIPQRFTTSNSPALSVERLREFPLLARDAFIRTATFCRGDDIARLECVCRAWGWAIANSPLLQWEKMFDRYGVPRISRPDRPLRNAENAKEEWETMFQATLVSGSMIARFLGKPVGPIPPVRAELVNSLRDPDPFAVTPGELKRDHYGFVVVPSAVERVVDQNFPFRVDACWNG